MAPTQVKILGVCPLHEPEPRSAAFRPQQRRNFHALGQMASSLDRHGVCGLKAALVRLRAHLDSGVKVPDLADTEGPVTESNCIGAITPGGEQLEVNDQSVTPGLQAEVQSELDSVGGFGEPASVKAKPKRNRAASAEGVDAAGREPQMVGDRMVGNPSD